MNDIQFGRTVRALRHRAVLTQAELAARIGVSQGTISTLERGRLRGMSLARLRGIVAELDAEVVLILSWRGGDLARLLDARHASLCESMTRVLDGCAWVVVPEVSYSRFGERGSIDLVGWHESTSTLLVIEVKSEITSVEETLRKHDAKVRLGPAIVRDRFGWDVRATARLLVLPEHRTIRRQIEDKRAVFGRAYPDRAVAIRGWLRAPDRPLAGLLFLPDSNVARGMRGATTRKRVRAARSSVDGDHHGSI
jgi:transcriptional regulator with XRE-family HTH domain